MLLEKLKKLNKILFKNLALLIILCIFLYIFIGNNNTTHDQFYNNQYAGEPYTERLMVDEFNSAPMLKSNMGLGTTYKAGSKVVKGYGLSIEVEDTLNIYSIISNEMTKVGGFIDSFNSYNYVGNELAYNFSLRIPTGKVDNVVNYFKSIGIVKNENSNSVDLTEQYSDNENRLKNLYSRRDRLRKMMENKTEKLSDILSVDRELSNVQIEIERLEKSNMKIDKSVEYSKLELSILPKVKVNTLNNSQWQISTSWNKAINKFIILGQKSIDCIFQFITLLPIIIVFVALIFLIKKFTNKTN